MFAKALIKKNPNEPFSHYWYGRSLLANKQYSEAIQAFTQALSLNFNHYPSVAALIFTKLKIASWKSIDKLLLKLEEAASDTVAEETLEYLEPRFIQPLPIQIALYKKIVMARAKYYLKTKPDIQCKNYKISNTKIHIGYIAADYNQADIGFLLRDIFKEHDYDKFEISLYMLQKLDPNLTVLLQNTKIVIHDLSSKSEFEIAKKIFNDSVNILLILSGYEVNSLMRILACKPAPLQCYFFGFKGTLGASYIEYALLSKSNISTTVQAGYTDKIIDTGQTVIGIPSFEKVQNTITRENYALPEKAFVYCNLTATEGIQPAIFTAWMEILQATPTSVLWLQAENENVKNNIKEQATLLHIDSNRIIFCTPEVITHTWRHQLADVWLDNGTHTEILTLLALLWSGLPIVALQTVNKINNTPPIINELMQVSELNAKDILTYIQKAIQLYEVPAERKRLQEILLQNGKNSPFFQPQVFIKNIEAQLIALIKNK